ncbi:hypothetical protein HK44_004295 [Pseudomonas fluorescens HK44]|uniref:Uncharacterized protein n=1 Tax=Pseudomonas fluorescens HK44 TaxID=1042209 RepID=A0A010RJX9_PSEFL|nr:hypothetical protein HK44_004295 [Pseudomonas fluorescens HK44]
MSAAHSSGSKLPRHKCHPDFGVPHVLSPHPPTVLERPASGARRSALAPSPVQAPRPAGRRASSVVSGVQCAGHQRRRQPVERSGPGVEQVASGTATEQSAGVDGQACAGQESWISGVVAKTLSRKMPAHRRAFFSANYLAVNLV